MKYRLLLFFIFFVRIAIGQNHYERFESIDIQHYCFEIQLNDTTDRIEGKTIVTAKFLKPAQKIQLDFSSPDEFSGKGMQVENVLSEGKLLRFVQSKEQLDIEFEREIGKNEVVDFEVKYAGIPGDGLIISKNKFGDRTFFGDNWPNRAHFWLPVVDHPSDKATLEFLVVAPKYYKVVSNGYLVEESDLGNNTKQTHWKEDKPISTKLMVIGVARFDVKELGEFKDVPASCWVFPQNREEGFNDFSVGIKPLEFFSELVGPYSYEKLAHVQSKTRYGGMENAGCIFYTERAVTGKNKMETLIAHETAHQWFGNSATEQNWHHVWLSEGFATYLTLLYEQHFYGNDTFKEGLEKDRAQVIEFADKNLAPVIDTTVTDYNQLLNANSYQKASWFLHMLQIKIGDAAFQNCLQKYYLTFKDSTALTSDLMKIAEETSGQNLDSFFHQWLFEKGFPVLFSTWSQKKNGKAVLKISQKQNYFVFDFPLTVELVFQNGETRKVSMNISSKTSTFSFHLKNRVSKIILDPDVELLFNKYQE